MFFSFYGYYENYCSFNTFKFNCLGTLNSLCIHWVLLKALLSDLRFRLLILPTSGKKTLFSKFIGQFSYNAKMGIRVSNCECSENWKVWHALHSHRHTIITWSTRDHFYRGWYKMSGRAIANYFPLKRLLAEKIRHDGTDWNYRPGLVTWKN